MFHEHHELRMTTKVRKIVKASLWLIIITKIELTFSYDSEITIPEKFLLKSLYPVRL